MENLKCDFCSDSKVVARYAARDFAVGVHGDITVESIGDWAACAVCEKLLDALDWNAVVERSTQKFFEHHPNLERLIDRETLKEDLFDIYAQLMQHGFRKTRL